MGHNPDPLLRGHMRVPPRARAGSRYMYGKRPEPRRRASYGGHGKTHHAMLHVQPGCAPCWPESHRLRWPPGFPLFSLLRRMCDEPSRRGPWPVRVVDSPCLPMSVPLKVVERQNGQKTTHKSSLLLDTADNVSDTAFLCPTQQGERPVDSPFGGVVSPPYASFRPQGGTSGTGAHEAVGEGAGQPPG